MKKLFLLLLLAACSTHARVKTGTESVFVYNASQHKVEYQQNADQVRSIASITKLMTAMVALDDDRDLDRKLMLSNRVGSNLPRQEYTRRQLLEALLVHSDNAAAETLAENHHDGRSGFIAMMNWYAQLWELKNTRFVDPSGLSPFNVSTVYDVSELVQTATGYWFIQDVGAKKHVELNTQSRRKRILLNHTSGDILSFNNVVVSKTGLTNAAGWCVGLQIDRNQKKYVIVVLGAKNKQSRYATIKTMLAKYTGDN